MNVEEHFVQKHKSQSHALILVIAYVVEPTSDKEPCDKLTGS